MGRAAAHGSEVFMNISAPAPLDNLRERAKPNFGVRELASAFSPASLPAGNLRGTMNREIGEILARSWLGMCPGTMHEDWGDDSDFRKQACEKESGSKLHALQLRSVSTNSPFSTGHLENERTIPLRRCAGSAFEERGEKSGLNSTARILFIFERDSADNPSQRGGRGFLLRDTPPH